MQISITSSKLAKMVEEKVKRGEYATPEDVIAAALVLLETEEATLPADEVDRLREELMVGVQQADRGEFVEFTAESIIAEETKRRAGGGNGN